MIFIFHMHKIIKLKSDLNNRKNDKKRDHVYLFYSPHRYDSKSDKRQDNHQCERDELFLHFFIILLLFESIELFVEIGVLHRLANLSHKIYHRKHKDPHTINKMPIK